MNDMKDKIKEIFIALEKKASVHEVSKLSQ